MTNENIIEISVKVVQLGEFKDFNSWMRATTQFGHEFGLNSKLLHLDCNGFTTTGYNLRNTLRDNVFPVKTFLLLQDNEVKQTTPFKSQPKS